VIKTAGPVVYRGATDMENGSLSEHQEALRNLLLYIHQSGSRRASQREAGCRVVRFLPQLITIAANGQGDPSAAEHEAIRAQICAQCEYQDANGYCPLRASGECCLSREEGRVIAVIRRILQRQDVAPK